MRELYNEVRYFFRAPFIFLKNVWNFRKELWHFRGWDYRYNLDMFSRSWELTADFLESKYAVSMYAADDAKEIRKFIHLLNLHKDPYAEVEKMTGSNFLELSQQVHGECWNQNIDRTTPEYAEYTKFLELVKKVENDSWKKAWQLMNKRCQYWWD